MKSRHMHIPFPFMFNRMMSLHTATLGMVWKFITSYCQNSQAIETQYLWRKPPKHIHQILQCLLHAEIKMDEAYWCLHGLHKLAEKGVGGLRLRTWTTHKPRVMVWTRNSGGPVESESPFLRAGEEKSWRTRKWHLSWSWLEESVSNVLHPCQALG